MIRKAVAAVAAGTTAIVVLPLAAFVAAPLGPAHDPSQVAIDDIPAPYLALYRDATARRCPGMPWSVLAAVGKVESDHGRLGGARLLPDGSVSPWIIGPALDGTGGTRRILDTDRGRYDRDTVYDRAVGPMQFIPTTWASFGVDASASGEADPHNAIDAIHSAAAYLCHHGAGAPDRLREAIWRYNNSSAYVDLVLYHAERYGRTTGEIVQASPQLIALVLANPRLDIYEGGRRDIETGVIDARVLTILQMASERWTLRIVSLKTGHSRCIGGVEYEGCRVSHHWHGRAADVSVINGHPVSRNNRTAREFALWLANLPEEFRPSEIGGPWPELRPHGPFFSDAAHQNHVHWGHALFPAREAD